MRRDKILLICVAALYMLFIAGTVLYLLWSAK